MPPSTIAHRPGSAGWIKALTREMTGRTVARITAPGGRGRASARLELADGGTLIATRRDEPRRTEVEAALLQAMTRAGAPAPAVAGYRDGLLLQEDAGRERLSWRLARAEGAEALALARAAVAALEACREALAASDLAPRLPGLGTRPGWAEDFVARPVFLSGDLGIAPPRADADALAAALAAAPERPTRWDARAGNAAVAPDGRVVWYDWAVAGRRAGVEDLAWLLADPAWPLDAAASAAVLADVPGLDAARGALLRRMAVVLGAHSLAVTARAVRAGGWPDDPDEALRLDRAAIAPATVRAQAARLAELAAADALTAPYADWFAAAGPAVAALRAG